MSVLRLALMIMHLPGSERFRYENVRNAPMQPETSYLPCRHTFMNEAGDCPDSI